MQTVATRWRKAWGPVLVAVLLWAAAAGLAQAQGASEKAGETGGSREPVFLDILDEDALLLVTRSEGRDVVRVLGRSQVRHKRRTVWFDQLEYHEDANWAVLTGAVQLVDEGEDPLHLTADYMELDLDSETAFARGNVQFVQEAAEGSSDVLHYGEYSRLQPFIQEELAARQAAPAALEAALAQFRPDDAVLILIGNVQMYDGDREFAAEFVVYNIRTESLVSVGRSAARLPGPQDD